MARNDAVTPNHDVPPMREAVHLTPCVVIHPWNHDGRASVGSGKLMTVTSPRHRHRMGPSARFSPFKMKPGPVGPGSKSGGQVIGVPEEVTAVPTAGTGSRTLASANPGPGFTGWYNGARASA